jgi:hypothetical protein
MADCCKKYKPTFLGLCFVNVATGFVQELLRCEICGFVGQRSTMYNVAALNSIKKHDGCIEVNT